MDKIKKYIDRFFKHKKMNENYDMDFSEWMALSDETERAKVDIISITFNFGYAKGYRAALSEMKKGGLA